MEKIIRRIYWRIDDPSFSKWGESPLTKTETVVHTTTILILLRTLPPAMKVSTILGFLFGGTTALASADSDDGYLRRGLVVEPTGACLDLTSISFSSACTTTTVFADVVDALETIECPNTAREEVLLLTGNATVSDARVARRAKCEATRVKCIPDLYTIDYPNCEDSTVMDTIATELLALDCDHNNRVEVLLQVQDAWRRQPSERNVSRLSSHALVLLTPSAFLVSFATLL